MLAIIQLGGRGETSRKEAVARIQSRIEALARAHDVSLGPELLQSADLEDLLTATLTPYDRGDGSLVLTGPTVELPTMRVTPIGMIMHELSTNAVKYGAWRSPGGKVVVRWDIIDQASDNGRSLCTLRLEWDETCASPLHEESGKDGFGSRLLNAAVLQLDGRLARERSPRGIRVVLDPAIITEHPLGRPNLPVEAKVRSQA